MYYVQYSYASKESDICFYCFRFSCQNDKAAHRVLCAAFMPIASLLTDYTTRLEDPPHSNVLLAIAKISHKDHKGSRATGWGSLQ